ncbi:poly(ADP-ribose) glycohydrolase ARH3 [Amycolatopsis arida]|uniref:Poly(ADP-ribose) glycohydrolase ARH3 n=1 Tax=Amycolatopsis arida TaxID=587909 RepID=A0A1I6ATR5_9PSEU|nr:ADP-ribosylglycohydrolase family protein [Amycolatopsis arida]TDX97525.1 poly(ADP-ribose) glycohydrolase ARH3 [Amycolatopsis arida]SFQ72063.1 poly(ADP-ribose) glycohydrolase ARH3 [Amycolatopsis arida]
MTPSVSRDRALGLLLGGALGDALGAPFEGRAAVDAAEIAAVERAANPLAHTDDTALTLALAAHLAARRDDHGGLVDPDALARELAAAWRAEPWRGYGPGAARVFELIDNGTPWRAAASAAFGGAGSFGNGAAMRVAPVALVTTSARQAAELGARTGELTHAHEHGRFGAATQAAAAYLALRGDPARPVDVTRFLRELHRAVPSRPWHEKLNRVAELVRTAAEPEHAARALGNDVSALGSVPAAVLAFLQHPDDPVATLRYALRVAGDADTIAAMAGALAGARCGAGAFPRAWVDRLEAAAALHELAGRLAG